MQSINNITQQIVDLGELQGLVEVYEEIAATKMQKIKAEIIAARLFYEELCQLSLEVAADISGFFPQQIKKTAVVFVGANNGLYGDIIQKTFQIFYQYIKSNTADVFVIGKLSEELMKIYTNNIPYKKLDFPDDIFDESQFVTIAKTLTQYNTIIIFHGQFQSIAVQIPRIAELSGKMIPTNFTTIKNELKIQIANLYEPSLLDVSTLFSDEILSTSMGQILSESQLAKLGSRLISLDQTIDRINEQESILNREKYRMRKKIIGKKQNNTIYSMMSLH